MPLLPVAAREIREASRQARTYAWRCGTAGATLGIMSVIGWVSRFQQNQGQILFLVGGVAAFMYCMLAGMVRTADCLSEEKRENTLGLLFLTDLKGWDIISGKLLSSSLNCFFGLVALMPILAIPMMMGGVSGVEFVRVLCGLLNTLFVAISWGILVSSIFRQSAFTISLGLLISIILGGILPFASLFLYEEYRLKLLSTALFLFSPLQGLVMAFDANRGSSPKAYFWTSLLVNHLIAWINLGLAVYFLPHFWQEAPKNKKTERWRDRFRAWRFGSGHSKTKLRTRLLNQNPFCWLSGRDRVGSGALMALSAAILTFSLICGTIAGRAAFRGPERLMISWFCGLAVVHLMVAFRIAMSASARLSEDRRSGALELILGTEVSVQEILRGQWLGLRRQFFGPIAIVLFASLFATLLMLTSLATELHTVGPLETLFRLWRSMRESGADAQLFWLFAIGCTILLLLCINWIAYVWLGMWLGLREKRSGFATWTTLALVLFPPWILFIIGMMAADDAGVFQRVAFEKGIPVVLSIVWLLGVGHVAALSFWARRNLLRRFREAASDRFMAARWLTWLLLRKLAIRLAIFLVVAYGVFALARVVINHRGDAAWKSALATHPNFNLIGPRPVAAARIPAEQNFAEAPMLAPLAHGKRVSWSITWNMSGSMSTPFGDELQWDWSAGRKRNLQQIETDYIVRKAISKANVKTTPAETTLTVLRPYDTKLAELQDESDARSLADFGVLPRDINTVYFMYANTRAALRSLVQTLSLRASAKIALKIPALDDVLLAARFPEGIRDARSIHEKHVMTLDLAQPIYDGLAARVWNADELRRLQEKIASFDLWTQYEAWREEYLRDAFKELEAAIARREGRAPNLHLLDSHLPTGFIRQQEADLIAWALDESPKAIDPKTRRIDFAKFRSLRAIRPDLGISRGPDEWGLTLNTLGLTQTTLDQIVTACALERFRIDHGKLPTTPAEFVPNYLPAIPNDVFTGQPLLIKIKSDSDNYTITGLGPDGVDDHGASPTALNPWVLYQDMRGYDWVWDSQAHDSPLPRRRRK